MGEHASARDSFAEAVAIRHAILGERDPDTVLTVSLLKRAESRVAALSLHPPLSDNSRLCSSQHHGQAANTCVRPTVSSEVDIADASPPSDPPSQQRSQRVEPIAQPRQLQRREPIAVRLQSNADTHTSSRKVMASTKRSETVASLSVLDQTDGTIDVINKDTHDDNHDDHDGCGDEATLEQDDDDDEEGEQSVRMLPRQRRKGFVRAVRADTAVTHEISKQRRNHV
jgi:hypothetical protein